MVDYQYIIQSAWLVLLFPLAGFLITGLLYKHLKNNQSGIIASGMVILSFVMSAALLYSLNKSGQNSVNLPLFNWIAVGNLNVDFSLLIDHLSLTMMMVVTGVGALIHIYSMGYMHSDTRVNTFFSYMNLFTFFMLLLIAGANYLVLFIGWEGVGLSSYLLIGYWYEKKAYNYAARKAFIMNRIGDLGFILGIIMLFFTFGSLTFSDVFARAALTHDKTTELTIITILLLIGATGKSAQIPLFTWLPDAMAGPTPVSALIHAATMVTAGIYMIARSGILFSLAPFTQNIIIVIGTATAVMAALTALKQNDIKKVLAYSTVSQLGYMFIALGLGAYSTAIFHVTTHAFFKALLFLGAGSVIHALHGEQDIRKMGGLKKSLPITYFTFIAGTLAISGIPPFAGFFSKDQILTAAFEQNIVLYLIALFTALVTCFYMFRLFFLVFHGQNRTTGIHPHESPFIMSIPLIILALLSVTGGFLNIPQFMGGREFFSTFLGTALPEQATNQLPHATEWLLMLVPVLLLVVVIYFAYQQFVVKKQSAAHVENNPGFVTKLLENKFYFDNLYQQIVEIPFEKLSVFLYRKVEVSTLDPLVDTIGTSMSKTGSLLRKLQQGNMSFYLFAMVAGILLFILFIFIV